MTIKTNLILMCEQAFLTSGSNNLNLIGVFNNVTSDRFPFTYPRFDLVVNFDIDALGEHTLETKITDGENQEIVRSSLPTRVTTSNFQVIAHFENLPFSKPGRYHLNLTLDGVFAGQQTLTVTHAIKHKVNLA